MIDNNKNTILAIVLSLLVLIAWQFLYVTPKVEAERQAAEIQAQREAERIERQGQVGQGQAGTTTSPAPSAGASGDIPQAGGSQTGADVPAATPVPGGSAQTREAAIANSDRVAFENDHISGSVNLKAARIDDLVLKDYRETIDKNSPQVIFLSPSEIENGYFAEFGFVAGGGVSAPGPSTVWRNTGGGALTPSSPLKLEWNNSSGISFRRTIELDDDYLFTITDEVTNGSGQAVALSPYGRVTRFGKPRIANIFVLHEGFVGVYGEEGLQEVDYDDAEDADNGVVPGPDSDAGWLGITDKYWATALIPEAGFKPRFTYFREGRERYQSDYLADTVTLNAGASAGFKQRFYAGAKKQELVDRYMEEQGILNFDLMIDWGWFYFITKPLFQGMNWLYKLLGNFGVAILVTTVIIKAILFPLANMSYASMAKMKKVQPELTKMKEKFGDDRLKMQQEMMALYKREKINPAAGCWPMLVQIPIFFALYKVIYVTIEMRHAPFFGWIQDLSAADPTSIFNLFGLLPYSVPLMLTIGIWPLLMGITMFLQMQMNPAPPDPTQAMIFKWMPIVFTFMLATFPAGLVIYWAWNNFLSIIQQGVIMRKHGVKIELWDNLKSLFNRKPKDEAAQ